MNKKFNIYDLIEKEDSDSLLFLKNFFLKHTKRIYLTGGAVRDIFLGITPKDFDIEVYDIEPTFFDLLMNELGAVGVGKSFYVYKWKNIDIAMPRIEKQIGNLHGDFEVSLTNDERIASKRRDFTINSIMYSLFDENIFDFWNGLDDIKNKTIRHIDKDSFVEDSLRILRGVQFASRFDMKIEVKTLSLMKELNIDNLSHERVFWELEKLFLSDYPEVGVKYLFELNLFLKLFGVNSDDKKIDKIINIIKHTHKKIPMDIKKYYLIYIVCGVLNIDVKKCLENLKAPNSYFMLKDQPFCFDFPGVEILANISIKFPMKHWLGLYMWDLELWAKEENIYENIFLYKTKAIDLMKQGLNGKELGDALLKKRLQEWKDNIKPPHKEF